MSTSAASAQNSATSQTTSARRPATGITTNDALEKVRAAFVSSSWSVMWFTILEDRLP